MHKIVIFGNSGSGKSTLAKRLSAQHGLKHLDLDLLAWDKERPTERRPLAESGKEIAEFIAENQGWVVEGCYSSLLSLVISQCNQVIFLNPGVDACVANCKNRPWEPHKYPTPEAQQENLAMLLQWVRQYPDRTDEFSLAAHQALFDQFSGKKTVYHANERNI